MPDGAQVAVGVEAEDGPAGAAPVEQVQSHAVDFAERLLAPGGVIADPSQTGVYGGRRPRVNRGIAGV